MVFSLPCYGLLAVAALATLFDGTRRPIGERAKWCLRASGVFFTYVIIRTLASPVEYIARTDLYMVLGALILYLLIVLHLNTSGRRLWIVAILMTLGAANVIVAIIQFAKSRDFMVFDFLQRGDYGTRASGFYTCPNHLSGFLETALLMGLAVACWSRGAVWVKILSGYAALMCGVGIMMTGSRGGYVSTFIGLVVFSGLSLFLAVRQHRKQMMWILGAGLIALGAIGFGVERMVDQSLAVRARVNAVTASEDVRLQLWQSAVKQFKLSPIIGTGSATYLYYGRQFRDPGLQTDPIYAHNDYLQFLAEFGLAGIFGLVGFLGIHIWSGWKTFFQSVSQAPTESHGSNGLTLRHPRHSDRKKRFEFRRSNALALTIGALSSAVTCMVHSFVDFNLHIPANTLVLAFVFGLLASPSNAQAPGSKERIESDGQANRFLRFVLPAMGLWMIWVVGAKLPAEWHGEKARAILSDGLSLDSDSDLRLAEDFATKALKREKQNPDLHYYLAEARFSRALLSEDPDERDRLNAQAAHSYVEALKLAPMDGNLYLLLGSALGAQRKFEEAEDAFQNALRLDPNSAQVRRDYAAHLHLWGKK